LDSSPLRITLAGLDSVGGGFWSEPQGRDLVILFLGVIFTILAFIPAITLFRLRKVEKLKWRFLFIGANELLVVGMYVNTLLKYFVAWAN
jgi:hypothetical membrane protein